MSGCHDSEDKSFSPIVEQFQKLEYRINDVETMLKDNWDLNYKASENLSKRIERLNDCTWQIKDELAKDIGRIEARILQPKDCHLGFDLGVLDEKLDSEVSHIIGRLDVISDYIDSSRSIESDHDERIEDLENIESEVRLINIERKLDELFKHSKKPHKCPVCDGTSMANVKEVDINDSILSFYKKCHACKGEGIVWG